MISKAEVIHRIEQMDTILSILKELRVSELRELEELEEAACSCLPRGGQEERARS